MLLAPVVASTLPPYPLPTVIRQIDDVITSSKIDRFDRPRWSDVPSAEAPSAAAAPSASAAAVGGWMSRDVDGRKSRDVDGWTSVAVPFHAAAELDAVPSSASPSLVATATARVATVAAVAEGEVAAAATTTRPSPSAEPLRVSWVSGVAGQLLTLLVPLTLGVAAFGLVLYRRAAKERQCQRARPPAEEECEEVYVRMPDGDGVAAGKPDRQYDRGGPWSGLPALAPHHGPRA